MGEQKTYVYWLAWVGVAFGAGCTHPVADLEWVLTTKLAAAGVAVALGLAVPLLARRVRRTRHDIRLSKECRQCLEEARKQIEQLKGKLTGLDQLKTRYFVNISHELRTPISLVLGPIERLLTDKDITPSQRRDLEVVDRNIRTLLKHVDSMLDLSELGAGRAALSERDVDLAQLLHLAAANFDLLAEDNHILFSIVTPGPLHARADAGKIERVFFTLLYNAIHSAPERGEVDCRLAMEGDAIVATFKDSGPGLEFLAVEPMFGIAQEHPPGSRNGIDSLGMAVAKEFVELHGGRITVENLPERGKCLRVVLPYRPPLGGQAPMDPPGNERAAALGGRGGEHSKDRQPDSRRPRTAAVDHNRQLVLVVEDSVEMNRFVSETLAPEYRTISAFDGSEGLQKALAERPDLIVSDLMMPGMTGEEMVRELRAHDGFGETPVVILTAVADEDMRFSLLQDYVQDYIVKPVRGPVLRARVKNLLSARKRELQLRASEQQLQALAAKLVSVQEEERSRLARELHDDLNQQLAALAIGLGSLRTRKVRDADFQDQIRLCEQQLSEVSQRVREIAHRLHPPGMEYLGLAEALRSHCEVFSKQTGVHVTFEARNVPRQLAPDTATCLFRIAQEGMVNVAKHSGASSAQLRLFAEGDLLRLCLVDLGSGFDLAATRGKTGLGLTSMEERARSQRGELTIQSRPHQGTVVEVAVPIHPCTTESGESEIHTPSPAQERPNK